MNSLYDMSVRLTMNVAGMTGPAMLAMRALQQIGSHAARAGAQVDKLGRSLALVGAGFVAFAAGMAGVGLLKGWIAAAASFQSAMAGVALSTKGTAPQLKALQDQTFITANRTQFSAPQVADMEKIAATNGLNQRDVLLRVMPTLGNLAEIDKQLRGIPYQQSIPAAITVAHDFQAYPKTPAQAKGFTDLLDLFGRSQLVAGTSPDTMAKLITYLAPARATLGLSPKDIISTAALASNVGLGSGRGGGSTIAAMFRTIVPLMTARGAMHNRALSTVEARGHASFFNQQGQFAGVTNMLTVVMRAMQSTRSEKERTQLLNTAFGAAGERALAIMATPGALGRFQSIQGLLGSNGIASTSTMQSTLNNTVQGQWATLQGNLTSIQTLLGQQLLPSIAPVLHAFVALTGSVVTLLRTHPQVAQFVATFVAVSTAAALIAAPVLVAAGAFGILSAAGFTLDLAFLPFTAIVLGIVGAVSLVVLAITHWSDITRFLGQTFQGVGRQTGGFLSVAGDLLSIFGQIFGALSQQLGLTALVTTVERVAGSFYKWWFQVLHLKDAFHAIGVEIQAFLKWADLLQPHHKALHTVTVHQTLPKPGSVQATTPIAGTVGMPTYLYVKPLPVANSPVPVHHPVPVPGKTGGGGSNPITVNNHYNIAKEAIVVHAQPHHNEQQIAGHVFSGLAEALGHAVTTGTPHSGSLMPALRMP